MSEFQDDIRKAIHTAASSYELQKEEHRRRSHEEAQSVNAKRAQVRDLRPAIDAIFQEAANASKDKLRYQRLADAAGGTEYRLAWLAAPSERGLVVKLDLDKGLVEWTWLRDGAEARRPMSIVECDSQAIKALILRLVAWREGNEPPPAQKQHSLPYA